MQQNNTQPQFDDVDEFAHVFDSTLPEDEWKIKLPYAVGHKARAKAKQDGISLSSLARRDTTGYLRQRNQDAHPLF